MLPRSLYIHIPWCIRKCPYCDFNSHKSPDHLPEVDYIDALIADFEQAFAKAPTSTLHSIFIGGGTPSLFSAQAFDRLFQAISKHVSFAPQIEITLEANPGTIEQQRFRDYRAVGINRLSLGIQSFHAQHLKTLGRIHDDQAAHQSIAMARAAGFDNLNVDLMYSLPHQTLEEGLADLKTALTYAPEHLSWYQLTIEPNTIFYKQRPPLPSDDLTEALEHAAYDLLAQNAYTRYEISAFSQANRASQHNLNYWLFGDYYGIGAGAHGKITRSVTDAVDGIYRTQKHRQPRDYLNPKNRNHTIVTPVPHTERLFEFMLNTTRLNQPIDNTLLQERTGLSFNACRPLFQKAETLGLLRCTPTSWHVTDMGRRYTNDLQELFLGDPRT